MNKVQLLYYSRNSDFNPSDKIMLIRKDEFYCRSIGIKKKAEEKAIEKCLDWIIKLPEECVEVICPVSQVRFCEQSIEIPLFVKEQENTTLFTKIFIMLVFPSGEELLCYCDAVKCFNSKLEEHSDECMLYKKKTIAALKYIIDVLQEYKKNHKDNKKLVLALQTFEEAMKKIYIN